MYTDPVMRVLILFAPVATFSFVENIQESELFFAKRTFNFLT
jgi:hypothetical protein